MNINPCFNCICVPVCKLKEYKVLVDDCSILRKLFYRGVTADSRYRTAEFYLGIDEVHDSLNPYHWQIEIITRDQFNMDQYDVVQIVGINLGEL